MTTRGNPFGSLQVQGNRVRAISERSPWEKKHKSTPRSKGQNLFLWSKDLDTQALHIPQGVKRRSQNKRDAGEIPSHGGTRVIKIQDPDELGPLQT